MTYENAKKEMLQEDQSCGRNVFVPFVNKIYNDIDEEFEKLLNVVKYTKDKELIVTLIKQTQKVFK